MGVKMTNKEIAERETERLVHCFNYALGSILKESDLAMNDNGTLQKGVKSVFKGADDMKVSLEITPALEVSIEKLGKKVVFAPDEGGYKIQKGMTVNAASMGDMFKDVNAEIRSSGLTFKYTAGGAHAPTEMLGNVATDYKVARPGSSVAEHAAVIEARDALNLTPL